MSETKAIIFYDGDCGFCSLSVRLIIRFDSKKEFLFAPLDSTEAKMRLNEDYRDVDTIIVFEPGGDTRIKYRAVLSICKRLPLPLQALYYLGLLVPVTIGDKVYDLIARNRHRLAKQENCTLLGQEDRKRFL